MSYDPVPLEWLALDGFLVTALVPWAILALTAHGFRWKSWWDSERFFKPALMWHPMAYSALFFFVYGAAGVGGWLVWREGFRSDNVPPNPSSGNIPDDTNYFLANIFYLIFWIMSCFIGPCFFIFSLEMKIIAGSCVLSFIVFGLAVALTVMGFLIWFVPGILFLVVAIFCAFQFIVSCAFYKDFRCEIVHHPIAAMEFKIMNIETNIINMQPRESNAPINRRSQYIHEHQEGNPMIRGNISYQNLGQQNYLEMKNH